MCTANFGPAIYTKAWSVKQACSIWRKPQRQDEKLIWDLKQNTREFNRQGEFRSGAVRGLCWHVAPLQWVTVVHGSEPSRSILAHGTLKKLQNLLTNTYLSTIIQM